MIFGEEPIGYHPRYDLLEAIIVNISKKHNCNDVENKLIRLLTDLFNEKYSSAEKLRILHEEHGMFTDKDFEREVNEMTAYTARITREAIEKGYGEGQGDLVKVIGLLRAGNSEEEILGMGYEQRTIDLAKTVK